MLLSIDPYAPSKYLYDVYSDAGVREEKMLYSDRPVTFLDEFQTLSDVQNDITGLFIRPLACAYVFRLHFVRFFYELILGVTHLIMLNPNESGKHFLQAALSLGTVVYSYFAFYIEIIKQLLSLVMRSTVSVVYGGIQLIDILRGKQQIQAPLTPATTPRLPELTGLFKSIFKEQADSYTEAGLRTQLVDKTTEPVRFWNAFQSLEDVQNDITGLLAKPLTCYFLSLAHMISFPYQLAFAFIHLFTLNPTEAYRQFELAMRSFVGIFYYAIQTWVEVIKEVLSLTARSLVTLGYGTAQAGTSIAGFFSPSISDSEMPSAKTAALPGLKNNV